MSDDFQGRGGSPWGTPPGGGNGSGRGPTPPDIDAIITVNKGKKDGIRQGMPVVNRLGLVGQIYSTYDQTNEENHTLELIDM